MSYSTAPPLSQGQEPDPALQALGRGLAEHYSPPDLDAARLAFAAPLGREKSEEWQTVPQLLKIGAAAGVKAFADAQAHITTLGAKSIAGLGSLMSGKGFGAGWQAVEEGMMATEGTTDPDSLDLINTLGKQLGLVDDSSMQVGQKADELIQRRLGNLALIPQTAGSIAAFMTGPGAAIGRGAAATVKPVSMLGERILARAAGKGAPSFEAGRVWDWMAETPQWLANATTMQRMLASGGRSIDDLLSVTAANVAQSYAMAPDDLRKRGAWTAAETSWLMLPIARIGQGLAGVVAAGWLSPAQAKAAKRTYDQLADGTIGIREADKQFRAIAGGTRMGLANLVSGAFEGPAFIGITPEGQDLMQQALRGDHDALGKLVAMGFGSVVGVVGGKYAVPPELAPLFKHVRPDLNKLGTYIEAEANKRALETMPKEEVPQEPQEPVQGPENQAARDRVLAKLRADIEARLTQSEVDTRAAYGWAEPHTVAILRAGFEPEFHGDTRDVHLRHGKDFAVDIVYGDEPTLVFSDKVAAALKEAGRDPEPKSSLVSPGRREAKGAAAHRILDDLALLAAGRQQQGDLTYTRLGMREVMPGVWADDNGGKHFTMQLDGSSATRDPLSSTWTGREDVVTVAGYGEPKWDHPVVRSLEDALYAKEALAPDPLVDGILAQAILQARHSDSIGAGQLRALFESVPPEAFGALLRPDSDEYLALLLGSLGSGHSNAPATAMEMADPGRGETGDKPGETSNKPSDKSDKSAQVGAGKQPAPIGDNPSDKGDKSSDNVSLPKAPPGWEWQRGESGQLSLKRVEGPTLSERLDPGDMPPEPGTTLEAGAMGGAVIKGAAKGVGKGAAEIGKEALGTYPDMLQEAVKNDPDRFVQRGLTGEAAGYKLEADVMEAARKPEKAARTKLGGTQKFAREVVQVDPTNPAAGTKPVWVGLADADPATPPRSSREQTFSQGFQGLLGKTWEASAQAGMLRTERNPTTGKPEQRPFLPRKRQTTPRFAGEDHGKVFGSDSLRNEWFQTLESLPRNKAAKITAAELEAHWKESKVGAKTQDAQREAAIELMRQVPEVPYTWRGYKVFESSPFTVMQRIAREHGARIGVKSEFGQSMPEATRAAVIAELTASGASPRTLAVLKDPNKRGIEAALEKFEGRITNLGDEAVNERMRGVAREWAELIQGSTPDRMQLSSHAIVRGYSKFEQVARSMLTAFRTGIFDVGEMLPVGGVGWQYLGGKTPVGHIFGGDIWRAAWRFATNPRDAYRYADQVATIDRDMADHNWAEAGTILHKLDAGAQWSNNFLERTKGAVLTRAADVVLERLNAGKPTINDKQVVRDLLRLPPDMEARLVTGNAPPQLQQLFRRNLVRFMTAKVRPAEGSRLAASKPLNLLFRFAKWSSRRVGNQVKTLVAVRRAARDHGWGSKEAGVAATRFAKVMLGTTFTGMVSQMLAYALTDVLRGEPAFKRWMDSLTLSPWSMAGKALLTQTLLGPLGQVVQAAINENTAERIAKLTGPGQVLLATINSIDDFRKGDIVSGMERMAKESGLRPPLATELAPLVSAWRTGKSLEASNDAKAVNLWKRAEGIGPSYGPKNKPEEYYEAIGRILSHIDAAKGDSKQALKAAMDDIRQALSLAPEESVAAAIDGHRIVHGLDATQRASLEESVNDDERMKRIYQHDAAMHELARKVRKMEGIPATNIEETLDLVEAQAAKGAGDQWGKIADQAVENATARLLAGESFGSEIEEVAMSMAKFPHQLESILSERQFRGLQSPSLDVTARARRIAAILRNRAVERRKNEMRERAKEKRDGR